MDASKNMNFEPIREVLREGYDFRDDVWHDPTQTLDKIGQIVGYKPYEAKQPKTWKVVVTARQDTGLVHDPFRVQDFPLSFGTDIARAGETVQDVMRHLGDEWELLHYTVTEDK